MDLLVPIGVAPGNPKRRGVDLPPCSGRLAEAAAVLADELLRAMDEGAAP